MAGTFTFRVVSPEGNVLKEEAEFVVLPGNDGELGILQNHAPLISSLDIGVARYHQGDKIRKLAISGGFVEVADNLVTVLANTAEPSEKIDIERAKKAKERAEKRLSHPSEDTDLRRAELALLRAMARIQATQE
ncbi:MAG: F0F1 ATP synthase subunit epsilon [Desulfitobacterium sp.]|mgnify:CR=1 FL=1|nr:F0F1 ATP synthase subunit epsilon [Desulfitobacterium sp.]